MKKEITVFNTKSRSKEVFAPIVEGKVGMYHCGPTVYNYLHIGNMRRFIFSDLVYRLFLSNGYDVKQIINITDVGHLVSDGDDGEDKIEKGAKREGKSAREIADFYTADFMKNLELLNIRTDNTLFPKATDNIPEQIALIETLEKKGFAYKISDGVYFDTSKDPHYADFAHLDIEGLKEGARVEINSEKKNMTDFALWKFSPNATSDRKREQEWPSPWGIGFPGWHIECSAMSMKFLGETFDLHTGGIDHIPVHHTNEIAQSESATGKTFANYWMHNEHLNFGKEKMAKSGESFIRLADLVEKGYHPLAYRYYILLAHYRTKMNFSYEGLDSANVAWKKLSEFVSKIKDEGTADTLHVSKAQEFFNNDLDTSSVIALMWEIIKDGHLSDGEKKATLLKIDELLGIFDPSFKGIESISLASLPQNIQDLIAERQKAREEKNWSRADELREDIKKEGYSIEDSIDGLEITKI